MWIILIPIWQLYISIFTCFLFGKHFCKSLCLVPYTTLGVFTLGRVQLAKQIYLQTHIIPFEFTAYARAASSLMEILNQGDRKHVITL